MPNNKKSVFISYHHNDVNDAKQIQKILESNDIKVFLAAESLTAGVDFVVAIQDALKKTDIFLAIQSQDYNQSPACQQEVGAAVIQNLTIVPVAEGFTNDNSPQFFIKNIQGIDTKTKDFWTEFKKILVKQGYIPKEERQELNKSNTIEETLKFYQNFVKNNQNKNNYIAYVEMGNINAYLKNYDDAIANYDRAIKLNPNLAEAYNNRGNAKLAIGQKDEAIKDYDEAITLNPNYAEAYNHRGAAKTDKGQYDEAIKDYDKAIELNPNNAKTYYNRGAAKSAKGQYDEAIKDYDRAITLNPDYAQAYNNRGNAKSAKGQYDEAIKDYNRAITLNPDYAVAYSNRGNAKSAIGQYDEALKDYNEAIRLNPDYAEAYNNRGNTKARKGQWTEALKDLEQAKSLNPNLLNIDTIIANLKTKL